MVYILDGGIGVRSRRRILSSIDVRKVAVRWITTDWNSAIQGVPVFGHVSRSTYFRLLAPELLPEAVERMLYVDADTVFLANPLVLGTLSMGEKTLFAVREAGATVSSVGLAGFKGLNIRPDAPLFNGGVLLIDVNRWRDQSCSFRVMQYLRENSL